MKKFLFSIMMFGTYSICAQAPIKKVVLEDFTGTWCGWCPEGTVIIDQMLAANPTNFIPVASHNGDALEVPEGAAVDAGLNVTAYPNGAVDRFQFPGKAKIPMSRTSWNSSFNTRKNTPAIVSVSFGNPRKNGTNYEAKINVKFTSAPAAGVPVAINVYLLEDSIPATGSFTQSNYSSAIQGGASPLTNWYHNATLRKSLLGNWGDVTVVPSSVDVGTTYSKDITFTIPATWNANHVNVVAFVSYNGTAASNQKEILNADQYPLKYWYPRSVSNVESTLQASVYPNPATLNSVIKTSFVLAQDAVVSLEVLNVLGQVVSQPYKSFEVSGAHTIQWSASENKAIGAGTYFLRISTDKGEQQTQKLVLQ